MGTLRAETSKKVRVSIVRAAWRRGRGWSELRDAENILKASTGILCNAEVRAGVRSKSFGKLRHTTSPNTSRSREVLNHQQRDLAAQVRHYAMAVMDVNYDQEMMRLWDIITDLSQQLNQHRATASALRNQAEGIKVSFCNAGLNEGPYAGFSRALEPSYSHSNRLRVT